MTHRKQQHLPCSAFTMTLFHVNFPMYMKINTIFIDTIVLTTNDRVVLPTVLPSTLHRVPALSGMSGIVRNFTNISKKSGKCQESFSYF